MEDNVINEINSVTQEPSDSLLDLNLMVIKILIFLKTCLFLDFLIKKATTKSKWDERNQGIINIFIELILTYIKSTLK